MGWQIRLAESKQSSSAGSAVTPEQADRIVKLEAWRQELQGLEASLASV